MADTKSAGALLPSLTPVPEQARLDLEAELRRLASLPRLALPNKKPALCAALVRYLCAAKQAETIDWFSVSQREATARLQRVVAALGKVDGMKARIRKQTDTELHVATASDCAERPSLIRMRFLSASTSALTACADTKPDLALVPRELLDMAATAEAPSPPSAAAATVDRTNET